MGDIESRISVDEWTHTATGASIKHRLGEDGPDIITRIGDGIRHLQVSGTFVGTLKIQVSVNGANWFDSAITSVTSEQYYIIEDKHPYIRTNCTAFTSGIIKVSVSKTVY